MTCQQLAISAFGDANCLQLQSATSSAPQGSQVLVAVAYAGVNPIDAKTRAGLGWAAQQNKDKLPWVPGYDIAGTVLAVGEDVTQWTVGQRVCGFIGFPLDGGAYSEQIVVDAHCLSEVPDVVTLEQAAALPLAGQTAWQALEKASVRPKDRVLILAGAGGVGHLAVQLAHAKGANVLATCSAENLAFVASLGAEAVDYQAGDLKTQIQPVDVLIDLVGGEVGIAALACVKPGGRVVTVPTITAEAVNASAKVAGLHAQGMLVSPSVAQNEQMLAMLANGELKIHIAAQFPLSRGADAHRQIETGRTRGKVVLMMQG
ncbi:NADP-dependent oxidoreductase [Photobacterium galatheae]|uniref:NADPH:quinone reductase n=1 Tax=Photobacterium galatheae TaxID=1654360 RepID=A0A066RYZ4_9GAMM|nr:NADP-dependent oxidoreductase [Photobacterium galatheae]KDM92603.1 NADPH:quinone reductase [Photobacterium galatheae]MCM0149478.1 NADP-dependent oxidoreductase [Photobacterium galatheae]